MFLQTCDVPEREIVAHSSFCHPHVVQFHEVFLTDEYLAIAMEFASGGDLFHHLTKKGGLKVKLQAFLLP